MTPTSVLLVPVQAAEGTIDHFRRRLDPTRRHGMPAHVTVLVPFAPPAALDGDVLGELRSLFAGVAPFEFHLRRTRWFERRVLFLEPEPSEPFRQLTLSVVDRFPQYPPYEGAFDDVVPHVTVGEGGRYRRRRWRMHRAASRLATLDPIRTAATEVWLMELADPRTGWRTRASFPLGGSPTAGARRA